MLMSQEKDSEDPIEGMPGLGIAGSEVINFAAGIPGFATLHEFRFEDLGPALRPFCRIRSVEDPNIGFTVVVPGLLFPDYAIEIDEEHVESLGLDSADDAATLIIVTVPRPPLPPTANLLGPIVINRHTGAAAQVVQHRSNHSVAEPVVAPGSRS
jgi:flagellar assembly factor FliW